jgi:hypothetical protein
VFVKGRTAWLFVALVAVFETSSTYLFLMAAKGSLKTLFNADELLTMGDRGANLLRLAAILDGAGYLSAIPIALYLRNRFKDATTIDAATFAGIVFMSLGAFGAVILALIGAPLLSELSGDPSDPKGIAHQGFEVVHRLVVAWIWQTADPLLAALWLIPTGLAARRERAWLLAVVLIAVGVLGVLVLLARLFDFPPGFWPA